MRKIASLLGRMRLDAGYESANDASRVLGCSASHLQQIERGRIGPSQALMGRMAGLYGVSIGEVQWASDESRRLFALRCVAAFKKS
jgi:transcriptional regulator with XRE-family HTH domain